MQEYKCQQCGYDLAGLAMRGQCPECGGVFDKSAKKGVKQEKGEMTAEERGTWMVRVGCAVGCLVLAMLILGLGVVLQYYGRPRGLAIGGLMAGVLLMGGAYSYVTRRG